MGTLRSLCVFCGSSPGIEPLFMQQARETGTLLAQRGRRHGDGQQALRAAGLAPDGPHGFVQEPGGVHRRRQRHAGQVLGIDAVALHQRGVLGAPRPQHHRRSRAPRAQRAGQGGAPGSGANDGDAHRQAFVRRAATGACRSRAG